MFRIDKSTDNNVALVGELIFTEHQPFKSMLDEIAPETKQTTIVFDLSRLEFIDSAGLGMLLIALDEVTGFGCELELRHPVGQVKRMFDISRFETLFSIRP